jgi:outer membrane protein
MGCIALTLLSACSSETDKSKEADSPKDTVIKTEVTSANAGDLTIGYYELERLATDFDFMRKADEQLTAEGQSIQDELIYWQRELETNYTKLNEGMNKGILTSTEQQALGKKVERAQQNLTNIQQNKAMKFQEKQADFNMKLEAKVLAYSEDFAKANGLKVLFARGPGSGISYIDGAFDMTDEFIEYMNARQKELNGEDDVKPNDKK